MEKLCSARSQLITWESRILTFKKLSTGIIALIQTFGESINLHPHLHILVTEGGTDKEGTFHKVIRILKEIIVKKIWRFTEFVFPEPLIFLPEEHAKMADFWSPYFCDLLIINELRRFRKSWYRYYISYEFKDRMIY